MKAKGLGYIISGRGSVVHSTATGLFVGAFDLLWELDGVSERVWKLDDDVTYVYARKNGETGISCGGEFFYELAAGRLSSVQPDKHDKFGGGYRGAYFLEYDASDSSNVINRILDCNGLALAESVGNDVRYISDWAGRFLFYKDGQGVVLHRESGEWEALFSPCIEYVDYFQRFENFLLIFGSDTDDRASCEVFDLAARSRVGNFSFEHAGGYVSEVSACNKQWYFLWGDELFRFNGEVEQVLPRRMIGGFYITAEGVSVLFEDNGTICLYDHDLQQVCAEIDAPLPGYVFNSLHSEGGRLTGYLRTAKPGRLSYAVILPIYDHGCSELQLEPPLFQVDRRTREQSFDLLVCFSGGEAFPTLLRQALAALADGFSQFENVQGNPDAIRFSGRIELHFEDLLTDDEKDLLLHGCQRVCALSLGREAPATGEKFNFRLVFAE